MPLDMEVRLGPGDFVLDGDPVPPQKGGTVPQFSAHVYCSQTAGWIKMPERLVARIQSQARCSITHKRITEQFVG